MNSAIKNINKIIFTIVLFVAFTFKVNAAGTVNVGFTGSDTATIGSTITLTLNISGVSGTSDGKIYSIGGYLDYDPAYLEFVSMASTSALSLSMNTSNYKFALVDYSMSSGASSGGIATVKFKTLKIGTTTVGMKTPSATDTSSNVSVNASSKKITIAEAKSTDATLKSLELTNILAVSLALFKGLEITTSIFNVSIKNFYKIFKMILK